MTFRVYDELTLTWWKLIAESETLGKNMAIAIRHPLKCVRKDRCWSLTFS